MTLEDYMDPSRFPLTTQKGLTPHQQFLIDAMNFDDLAEAVELDRPMDEETAARWAELQEKRAAWPQVRTEASLR